jgi:hypothetical protein
LTNTDTYWPGAISARITVGGFEDKGDDVGGFFDAAHHAVGPRRLVGVHIRLLVQPRFLGD